MSIRVYVDEDDVLEQIETSALIRELENRKQVNGGAIPITAACDTLDEVGRLMRKAKRYDLAFKLDEIKEDFVK